MKRNLWFKILSLFAVFCMCFSFAACNLLDDDYDTTGDNQMHDKVDDDTTDDNQMHDKVDDDTTDDKHIHGKVDELLTVEELVDFYLNGAKVPENFVYEELNGYGRVIESTSSREEALEVATEHFNSGWCTTVECRLTVETDLFYGLYVKWDYRSGGVGDPEAYYDEYVVSFKKQVYDDENKQFFTKDEDEIKSILDYKYYSYLYKINGAKIYSSDIALKNNKYIYTAYLLDVTFGDWDMQDCLSFLRREIQIDTDTGGMEHSDEVIGTVFIDGEFTYY